MKIQESVDKIRELSLSHEQSQKRKIEEAKEAALEAATKRKSFVDEIKRK